MKIIKHAVWVVALVWAAGCSEHGTTPANPVTAGQDDFVTVERDWSGGRYGALGGASDTAGGMSPGANATGAAAPPAPNGRTGTVEEADIYRVDGNRLFYLNTYRGFIAYDLTDPKHPQRVSRLPVHGYPIEMFVTPTTVYALLRDALYVTQDASGLRFKRHNVSQLVAIDITDLRNPRVLKTVDIVGELREGVSRKIDDTIYVVSYLPQSYYWPGYPYGADRKEQAWVYSFNVANPSEPVLVDRLQIFEGGGGSTNTGGSYSGRWFTGVAISATANTLHVVENWQTWGYVQGSPYHCGNYSSQQEAVVSIVDISDPTGHIRVHSHFSTYGALTDQFKQTYVYDAATGKGHYLGIFARQEWNSSSCSGTRFVQNNLESWDITDGANPVKVSSLPFGKPNETVRGSTFDMQKQIAYAITAQRVDPLYALSFADPTNLRVLSAVDGLSGDMNVFRLIDGGNFLLGIGRDNSEACAGFGNATVGWAANVAVSIIDVRDSAAIRLVQRKCVTVNDASWVWSDINWNLDQAAKMIGLYSDARASVVSVPVNYYAKVDTQSAWWWYRPESAVGLMSFDTRAYDPTKPPADQAVLVNHGTVVHGAGTVRRSVVFTHQGATPRRMMVNLSDTNVSVVDIEDLDHPQTQATIEVAPYHQRVYRFGQYVVDEVKLGGDDAWYSRQGGSEFRVKVAQKGVDEAQVVASVTVGRVQQVVQFKNQLIAFREPDDAASWRDTEAVVVDFTDPTRPAVLSTVRLPTTSMPWVWYGCIGWGWWPYAYYGTSWAVTDRGLGLMTSEWQQNAYQQKLVFLDLSNPAAPQVNSRVLATQTWDPHTGYSQAGRQYLSLIAADQGLFATFKEKLGTFATTDGAQFGRYRYYAERYTDATLSPQAPINVLGRVIRAWRSDGKDHFLTTDDAFTLLVRDTNSFWVAQSRLHLLVRPGDRAQLTDTRSLDGLQVSDMVGDADKLFLTLRQDSWYWYAPAAVDGTAAESPGDALSIIDLRADTLDQKFLGRIGTWGSQLMGVNGDRLFVNLPGDGVLVVDVSNLSAPVGQHFVRTLGWATHLTFAETLAFVAAGNFGIYEIDLAAPPTIIAD